MAKAADEYQKAREELDPLNQQAKDMAGGLLDSVGKAFVEACSQRIDITPPGHYGVISLVSDTGTAQTRFPSSLVSSEGVGGLGARVALSSATLVKESSDEGKKRGYLVSRWALGRGFGGGWSCKDCPSDVVGFSWRIYARA